VLVAQKLLHPVSEQAHGNAGNALTAQTGLVIRRVVDKVALERLGGEYLCRGGAGKGGRDRARGVDKRLARQKTGGFSSVPGEKGGSPSVRERFLPSGGWANVYPRQWRTTAWNVCAEPHRVMEKSRVCKTCCCLLCCCCCFLHITNHPVLSAQYPHLSVLIHPRHDQFPWSHDNPSCRKTNKKKSGLHKAVQVRRRWFGAFHSPRHAT